MPIPTPTETPEPYLATDLKLIAATLRGMVADMVEAAGNGHAGGPLGLADVAAVLFWNVLRYDPTRPLWPARDRFILSNGHASALLYACLHLAGFGLSVSDLKRFRQLGSSTPGHPELGACPGVEMTTGPLGQGFATAVGIALGQRLLAHRFPPDETGFTPADGRTFVVCSDGDLMEGVTSEAVQLAGCWGLGNLVVIYDCNEVTIDGPTRISWGEDVPARFAANGWRTVTTSGHDLIALCEVLGNASQHADDPANDRPTLVVARTTIGRLGGPKAGSHTAHWGPLGPDEIRRMKSTIGLDPEKSFDVPDELAERLRRRAWQMTAAVDGWYDSFVSWRDRNPADAVRWGAYLAQPALGEVGAQEVASALSDAPTLCSINELCGMSLNAVALRVDRLVGGSADLAGSTHAAILSAPYIRDAGGARFRDGRNIHFGVREHAGAAIVNGLTLHGGFQGFFTTFLAFSDYCRPAIRLAALMRLPSIFYFSHDSVLLGPDGPTHQPVEHIWSLRLIPNVRLFRPADAVEVANAWQYAVDSRIPSGPVVIVATPKPLPRLRRPPNFDPNTINRGGYVLNEDPEAHVTLCATGSEVQLAVEACVLLASSGIRARVASLPCLELFNEQTKEYREEVLRGHRGLLVVTIEAGVTGPWYQYLNAGDLAIGIDEFGTSASWADIAPRFGLTPEQIASAVSKQLNT